MHALIHCKHEKLKKLKDKFLSLIYYQIPTLEHITEHELLLNLLNGEHPTIWPTLFEWLSTDTWQIFGPTIENIAIHNVLTENVSIT